MPRTRTSQPRPSLLHRIRPTSATFRRLLGVAVIAVVLGVVAFSAVSAVMSGNEAKRKLLVAQQETAEGQRTLEQSQAYRDWLMSPEGIRAQGYQDGLVGPGEEVIRFPAEEAAASASPAPAVTNAATATGAMLAALLLFALAFLVGVGLLLYRWRAIRKRRPVGMLTPRSELRRRRRHAPEPLHE